LLSGVLVISSSLWASLSRTRKWSANGEEASEEAMSWRNQRLEEDALIDMIPPDGPDEDSPESFLLFLFLLLIGMKAEEVRLAIDTKAGLMHLQTSISSPSCTQSADLRAF
jgi:hypothetical protein